MNRRKDCNGRILRDNENQLQNNKYEYSIYVDGKTISVECDDLDNLREMERKILRATGKSNEIVEAITVNDVYDNWLCNKKGLKPNTLIGYKYSYEHYVKSTLGIKKIADLCKSDIKKFYNKLADNYYLKAATIDTIHTVLHQVLQTATDDGLINANPSDRALFELRRSHNYDGEKKIALSVDEEKLFLKFVKNNSQYSHWYLLFDLLLHTGLRIGEATALTWKDINLDNNEININKTLVYYSNGEKSIYGINTPKTKSGVRIVPITGDVKMELIKEKQFRDKNGLKCNVTIDGVSDFVFINRFGGILNHALVNKAIKRIVRDCNDAILETATNPDDCILLPNFSCHNFRHTFATRLYEQENISLKSIQQILGHSDISTTLDVYTKLTDKKRREIFEMLNNNWRK